MESEVTIMDVAEKAGVSPSTVSRVINESAPVADSTRSRVIDAVESLNYRPNKFAHALRKQSSGVCGIIVPDISNPFFSTLIRGAEDRLHEKDLSVIICDTEGEMEKEKRNVEMLIKERVDGVIVTSAEGGVNGINRLFEEGIPVIAADRKPTDRNIPAVLSDDTGSGRQATEHLIGKGCRSIGFIRGPRSVSTAEGRFWGYQKALKKNGLSFQEDLIAQGNFTFESGKNALKEILVKRGGDGLPDGLVVANDLMAVGVIRKSEKLGIGVPEELAVVGFDNILLSRLINPKLTTVSVPTYRMGEQAVDYLLNEIGDKKNEISEVPEKTFKTKLIERESSQFSVKNEE